MIDLPLAARLAVAAALALAVALAITPLAIRVARARGLFDHPRGWKSHPHPTPYLGGWTILVSAAVSGAAIASDWPSAAIIGGALALAVVGTIDDARTLHATPRVMAELACGVALWSSGGGWEIGADAVDLTVTCIWVLAVVNALNLLDLVDGVATAAATVSSAAIMALLALNGQDASAIGLAALAGACAGFLPYNLSAPRARIYLGDGGTMPIGFLLAAAVPNACAGAPTGLALVGGCLLLAVPLLDATVRTTLRIRRGVSPLTPGTDSIANRLLADLGFPRRVALVIASAQALCAALAALAIQA